MTIKLKFLMASLFQGTLLAAYSVFGGNGLAQTEYGSFLNMDAQASNPLCKHRCRKKFLSSDWECYSRSWFPYANGCKLINNGAECEFRSRWSPQCTGGDGGDDDDPS